MIIGNPYTFSIIIDIVDEWNIDKSFNNGLLFMGINGVLIPNKILSVTLNAEVFSLIKKLENPIENINIFSMEKNDAFICICRQIFSDDYSDANSSSSYDITPWEFADNDYFVFMVSNGKHVRILSAELQYVMEESVYNLEGIDVIDTYISSEELKKIIEKLRLFEKERQEN